MRILVVSSYPPRHCGIAAFAREQVARLRSEGHEVTVLAPPDGDGDMRARFIGGSAFRRAAAIGRRFDRIIVHFQPALYFPPRRAFEKVMTSVSLGWLVARRRHATELLIHDADPPIALRTDYVLLRMAFLADRSVHTSRPPSRAREVRRARMPAGGSGSRTPPRRCSCPRASSRCRRGSTGLSMRSPACSLPMVNERG